MMATSRRRCGVPRGLRHTDATVLTTMKPILVSNANVLKPLPCTARSSADDERNCDQTGTGHVQREESQAALPPRRRLLRVGDRHRRKCWPRDGFAVAVVSLYPDAPGGIDAANAIGTAGTRRTFRK